MRKPKEEAYTTRLFAHWNTGCELRREISRYYEKEIAQPLLTSYGNYPSLAASSSPLSSERGVLGRLSLSFSLQNYEAYANRVLNGQCRALVNSHCHLPVREVGRS